MNIQKSYSNDIANFDFCSFRCEVSESGEAEEAGDTGEHMEDDNGGPSRAAHEAPEEVGHVGAPASPHRRSGDQIGDVQGAQQLRVAGGCKFEDPKGTVAESGGVESASGGVHPQIQRGNEDAEARIIEPVHGDDKPWGLILVRLSSPSHPASIKFALLIANSEIFQDILVTIQKKIKEGLITMIKKRQVLSRF